MIFQLFFNAPLLALIVMISIIIAISLHEAAHAYSAYWLGDDTPKLQGRLTVNPMSHLDLWGTILIALVGIGWGKPVQFNPYNLKNPRRDTALIAIAGPATNIVLAILAAILLRLGIALGILDIATPASLALEYFLYINIVLAIFNMIPINPLDGFKVVAGILPPTLVNQWEETRKYGMYILIFLLITGAISRMIMPLVSYLTGILYPTAMMFF